MPSKPKRPRKEIDPEDALASVTRGTFDLYRELYPSLPERLRKIWNLDIPFVKERIGLVKQTLTERAAAREESFQKRYALTETQARIAIFLAEGGSVSDYAKKYRVSTSTVRVHLKAIFKKTGVTRQASLVTLLHERPMRRQTKRGR